MKKALSLILAVVMLMGVMPINAVVARATDTTECPFIPLSQTIAPVRGEFYNDTGEWLNSSIYGCVIGYELKKGHTLSINNPAYVFAVRKLSEGNYNTLICSATSGTYTASEDMTVAIRVRKPDSSALTDAELASILLYDTQFNMKDVPGYSHRFTVEAETIEGGTSTTRAAIFLPESYTDHGSPTRLIIMTNGRNGYLTDSVWNGNKVDDVGVMRHYMENNYAVLVVNNTADTVNGAPDWGNPQLVDTYWKAYEYVQAHLNVEERFSIHSRSMGTFAAMRLMREHPELVKCALMCGAVLSLQSRFSNDPAFLAERYGFDDKTGKTWEADKVVGYDPYTDVNGMEYDLPPTFWMLAEADATGAHLTTIEKIKNHGNDVAQTIYTETDHSGVCRLNIEACRTDSLAFLEKYQENTSDHRYCAWSVTKNATCVQAGELRRNCADCDHYETKKIPKLADHVLDESKTYCTVCGNMFEMEEISLQAGHFDDKNGNWMSSDIYGCVIGYELKKGKILSISDTKYVFAVRQLKNGNYNTLLKSATSGSFTAEEDMVIAVRVRKPNNSALTADELAGVWLYVTECVEHTHSYTSTVTAPTCTEQGYTTYTCECGDSYVDDYVDAIGHSYDDGVCIGCGKADSAIYAHIGVSSAMGNTSGRILEVIDFPSLPYSVYEIAEGTYGVENILASQTDVLTVYYYVDSKLGSDDHHGTDEDAPFRTLKKALTVAGGKAAVITILDENAVFFADELYGTYAVNQTTVIKAKSGATILGGIRDVGFTMLSGYTNTYVSSDLSDYTIQTSEGVSAVVETDIRNVDEMGIYRALLPVSSVEEVEATEGSFYYDAETARMYVNPRYNIATVYPLTAGYPFRFNLSKATGDTLLYMENLNVIGGFLLYGRSSANDSDSRNLEFVANNCTFQHNFLNNCVSVHNFNSSYMVDCRVGYSLLDGYNYHASNLTTAQRLKAIHVEVNCRAEHCGYYRMKFGVGVINNNLSTAHEGINVLRVNFSGHDSYGPQIADVNGCRSVNIDCTVSNSYQYKGSAHIFQFSQTSAIRKANITLIDCCAYGSRSGELRLYSNVERTTVVGGNLLEKKFYTVVGNLLTEVQEHPHSYTPTVTAPTCTEQGYTTYTCDLCDQSYVADYVDVTDHTYENGYCTVCHSTLSGDINGDGAVTSADLDALRAYLVGIEVAVIAENLDPNGDGVTNMRDVALLAQYLAGLDVTLQ